MITTACFRRAFWLGVFGVAALGAAPLWADDKPAEGALDATEAKEPQAAPSQRRGGFPLVVKIPKYHLDMHLAPVPPVLNDQLDLKGEGVVVMHVGPGGPADKAGVKANDLVMAVGDKSIKEMSDLMAAVEKSEGKELSLKLLRAGKPITVAVTPAEHPKLEERLGLFGRGNMSPELMEEIRDLQAKIREKLKDAGVDMRMQFNMPFGFGPPPGGPGALGGPGFVPGGPPEGPDHHGRGPGPGGPPHPDGPPPGPDGPPHAGPEHRGHHAQRSIEHRLSEMSRQMDHMHRQIEELRRMLHDQRDDDDRDDGPEDAAPSGERPPQ